ncbi:acetamidase/formamidase family protein [Kineococcus rubinsiae]|uniref:acetamidase/formamidase family protein n=1 Tax=Kineococcus rubinsiae TaxID=2609562 RepID=UPI0027E525E2|nr:acetamidase/formamidase family protein [Kineococcus rubinsiae]NIZ89427.1 acetamidase [Kineococcus rubinsiae]
MNPTSPTSSPAFRRRSVLRAAAGLGAGAGVLSTASPASAAPSTAGGATSPHGVLPQVLQPGRGPRSGRYVRTDPASVLWGRLPNRDTEPVTVVSSGDVVTIDTVSHEGILEDQGRDPRGYFTGFGVRERDVLRDAVAIAAHTPHDGPGPHVVNRPVAVTGAQPGDVLKVEVLDLALRVPYGVISNRHGKGALPGEFPEQWEGDAALADYFNVGGEVSVFTPVAASGGTLVGALPGPVRARFPLRPFLGVMGVARDTGRLVDSVPPTDTGGNVDIKDLVVGSTLYLPVRVPGAQFFVGDPHMAQGDGEVALTALEGSLRATLRLTVVRPGDGAPKAAAEYPFAETAEHWIPIGLSDPDGPEGGAQGTDLAEAMRTAVRQGLSFLTGDLGMPGPVAYAYLSAATDFHVSQVVDRTTGVHGLIRKADFDLG